MKINRTILILCLLGWLCAFSTAHALPVVEWGTVGYHWNGGDFSFATTLRGNPGSGAAIWGVSGHLIGGDPNITMIADNGTVGIAHQWFEVTYGELISDGTAAVSDPFATVVGIPEFHSIYLEPNQPFYLGFQLGGYASSGGVTEFGWAELLYDGTEVSMVSSASERTGLGIYAGTGNAVPEPATMGLILVGALGLAWRKRTR